MTAAPHAQTPPLRTPTTVTLRSAKGIAGWFAAWRTTRARRRALATLLEMSEARLVDLGIERQDIFLAMEEARYDAFDVLAATLLRGARR